MTQEPKHTPTPWDKSFIYEHEGCGCCTSEFQEQDVEFILSCANSHDALVEVATAVAKFDGGWEKSELKQMAIDALAAAGVKVGV